MVPTDVSAEMGLPLQGSNDADGQKGEEEKKYKPIGSWREDGLHHKESVDSKP